MKIHTIVMTSCNDGDFLGIGVGKSFNAMMKSLIENAEKEDHREYDSIGVFKNCFLDVENIDQLDREFFRNWFWNNWDSFVEHLKSVHPWVFDGYEYNEDDEEKINLERFKEEKFDELFNEHWGSGVGEGLDWNFIYNEVDLEN